MKYKNRVQQAREKYLKQKLLSVEEQSIIDKDFRGKDYAYFQSLDEDNFILPEQYSAEASFSRIEQRFGFRSTRRPLLKYAVAVVLLTCATFSLYYIHNYPRIITVSTSYGEKKEVSLPDGSSVILNSLSTISYPKKMKGDTREVVLEGEAFFDVVKNDRKTFIVITDAIKVKVLGTKFNVLAYSNDDKITTSLYEGAVAVTLDSGETFRLRPGEQAVYDKRLKSVDIESLEEVRQSWLDGSLCFNHKPLKEIWKILEREKNVFFEVSARVNSDLRITASFDKNDSIEELLNILGQTGGFTFERIGNTYVIDVTPDTLNP